MVGQLRDLNFHTAIRALDRWQAHRPHRVRHIRLFFLIREVPALKKASIEEPGGRRCPVASREDGEQQHEARGSSEADVAGRIICSTGANP